MNASEFFLGQYDTVRSIIDDRYLRGLNDEQWRHQPEVGLNSIAWYLWHTARWQDYANTLIENNRSQVLNPQWMRRMNVPRSDVGTGMTRDECTRFNETVEIAGLRAYWLAVGDAVREVATSVHAGDLKEAVDKNRLYRMLEDGAIANERAKWLPAYLQGKTKSWFLSMAVWHMAEHLMGGVACVRRVSRIPVGL
jgi:DinB superfamily